VVGSDADIHRQRHRDADAGGGAVDGADHRLLQVEQAQRDHAAAVAVDAGGGGDVTAAVGEGVAAAGQVHAGAERAAGAGHDQTAHIVVGVDAVQRIEHFVQPHVGERVHLFGAVQRDGGDVVGNGIQQLGVGGHGAVSAY